MKALAIAETNLRRLFRERSNIFFVFIFPMLLILLLGATFGGAATPRIGIVAEDVGPWGEELVAALSASEEIEIVRSSNEDSLLTAVERGRVQAGLVLPPGYSETLESGGDVSLRYFARPDQVGQQLRSTVEAAVASQATLLRAARFIELEQLGTFDEGLELASALAPGLTGPTVDMTTAGEAIFPESLGAFDLSASSQLLLFIFLTSLTGSVALIETRRLGLSRRMLSTPTAARTIIAGEAIGRFSIALVQGVVIMIGSLLLFGVNWGDPLGALAILVTFSMVGSGAGMLTGAVLSNTQQGGAVGLLLGLGLAALGGSMVPLEVFPDPVRLVAHVTPHAWALDGFAELVRHDGTIADIAPELGVLLGYAAALLTMATWSLRRAITS